MEKTITYDRITRDYRMEIDGQFIGYAPTYSQAEITLNQTTYEWLTHGYTATATDLDGGAVPGESCCAACGALLHCECSDDDYFDGAQPKHA